MISVSLIGDSHALGYQSLRCPVRIEDLGIALTVLLEPHSIGAAYTALEMVVTFPDGREALNPSIQDALQRWPGLGLKDRPLGADWTVQKELVLSFGTGMSLYDPAFEFDDRTSLRLLFRPDIDFLLPGRADLPIQPTSTIVPFFLVQEMFEAMLIPMERALELLKRSYSGHLWIVGAPPPAEDGAILSEEINKRARRASQPPVELPPAPVLLKTWLVMKQCVEELCQKVGCRFIDCTPTAADAKGYLKPEFVHDGVHGNTPYNEAMSRHIISTLVAAVVGQPLV